MPWSGRGRSRHRHEGSRATDLRTLLAVVPDTIRGRRDRAILLTLVLTGRRRSEVLNLTAGDISTENDTAFYSYRGKGGKTGRRELPRPAYEAVCATLSDAGRSLGSMSPSESLWQAGATSAGITSGTFYGRFRATCGRQACRPQGCISCAIRRPS